jgi:hypothetical protein
MEGRAGTLVVPDADGLEYWPSLFHQEERA